MVNKPLKNEGLLSLRIGAAFVGTVIGAGFASGQEIMQFFTIYGPYGMISVLFTGIIFISSAYLIFDYSSKLKAFNYCEFVNLLCGNKLGFLYDILITLFLFLGVSIMFAGSAAIFQENLGLPKIIGIGVICISTLLVVFKSLDGILRVNSIIVPVISILIVISAFKILKNTNLYSIANNSWGFFEKSPFKAFFFMTFYCSYNLVMSLGVLIAFPQMINSKKALFFGALIGGLGLMVLALLLNALIMSNIPYVLEKSVPMLYIISNFHPFFKLGITLCIWCEIFSTAVSNVFSLGKRFSKKEKYSYNAICTIVVLFSIPLSFFEFKSLIGFFYPLFGALSIFLIFYIFFFGILGKFLHIKN